MSLIRFLVSAVARKRFGYFSSLLGNRIGFLLSKESCDTCDNLNKIMRAEFS